MATILDIRGSAAPLEEIEQALNTQGVPMIVLAEDDKAREQIEGFAAKRGFAAFADQMENGTYRVVIQPSSLDMFMFPMEPAFPDKIGRASCRERVSWFV